LNAFKLPADVQLDDLSIAEFRASLTTLLANATDLVNSLDSLSLPKKKSGSSDDK
jgi:hypothetical protein